MVNRTGGRRLNCGASVWNAIEGNEDTCVRHGRKRKSNMGEEVLGTSEVADKNSKVATDHEISKVKLSSGVFNGKSCTYSGVVKSNNQVVRTVLDQLGKSPNVNCRVESFGRIVGAFDDIKRKWISEMGFSSLLYLEDRTLPRLLCYWLVTRLDTLRKVLILPGDTKELPLNKNQVHWVLGIPLDGFEVPNKICSDEMMKDVKSICQKYGVKFGSNKKGIPFNSVGERLACVFSPEEELEFKIGFLILSLAGVLCPTTSDTLASDLLPAVTVAVNAAEYDWSEFVLHKLVQSANTFVQKFYGQGYSSGCGGCTYFLAILYLDRLKRTPLQWGVYPRIKVWTVDEVNQAKAKDNLQDDQGRAGDFGKLGCVEVAYGYDHPLGAKDTSGPMNISTREVASILLKGLVSHLNDAQCFPRGDFDKPKRAPCGSTSKFTPNMRKMEKQRRRAGASNCLDGDGGDSSAPTNSRDEISTVSRYLNVEKPYDDEQPTAQGSVDRLLQNSPLLHTPTMGFSSLHIPQGSKYFLNNVHSTGILPYLGKHNYEARNGQSGVNVPGETLICNPSSLVNKRAYTDPDDGLHKRNVIAGKALVPCSDDVQAGPTPLEYPELDVSMRKALYSTGELIDCEFMRDNIEHDVSEIHSPEQQSDGEVSSSGSIVGSGDKRERSRRRRVVKESIVIS